jgi:hypothetical protein
MAVEFKHKRYIRIRLADSSLYTFTTTNDAQTKIAFKDCINLHSPIITYTLADSNQTMVMTVEHESVDNQVAWKEVWDAEYQNGWPWNGNDSTQTVEHFKTEWLNADGTVSATANLL